jgi:hypothetical protein
MQLLPFQNVRHCSFRKITINAAGLDLDSNLEISVDRMKMGRPVFSVVHGDNNAKKAT